MAKSSSSRSKSPVTTTPWGTMIIGLTTKQARPIVAAVFPDYAGRSFRIEFTDKITFHDVNWGDGTRNYYAFVRQDGATAWLPSCAPWGNPFEGQVVEIPTDVLVVEHSIFCGRDLGIRIYANPAHLPKWLPEPKGA